MTDDTNIPDDDAIASAARRALRRLADGAASPASWDGVRADARRVRLRRIAAAGATVAILLAGIGSAAALVGRGNGSPGAHIAGRVPTTTTSEPATTTTSTPPATSTTRPANITRPTLPPSVSVPTSGPSNAPGAGDFSGTITIGSGTDPQAVEVGSPVDITATIQNVSDHTILASSSTAPTALATVCTGETPGSQSLWWMTNLPLAPGDTDARTGTFTPTYSYLGTVNCELDVVSTLVPGTDLDTSAGGDTAHAAIVARVTGVARVTLQVVPTRWRVTTDGVIGPLQLDVSTDNDVRTAVGKPDATKQASFLIPSYPDYLALGYDCSDQAAADRIPLQVQPSEAGPYCRTVYYVNTKTSTLAAYRTTTNASETEHRTAVGDTVAAAQTKETQTIVPAGCLPASITVGVGSSNATTPDRVTVYFKGTAPSDPAYALSAESATNPVGLLSC